MAQDDANVRVISSTEEKTKILRAVKEISNSQARIEGERDFIKDAKEKLVKEHNLPKKIVNRLIKTYHKGDFDRQVAEEKAFENLYLNVTGVTK